MKGPLESLPRTERSGGIFGRSTGRVALKMSRGFEFKDLRIAVVSRPGYCYAHATGCGPTSGMNAFCFCRNIIPKCSLMFLID